MCLTVRATLHYCVANGRVVCLDLANDRYFALPDDLDATFQAFITGTDINDLPQADIARLRHQDLLVETASVAPLRQPTQLMRPTASIFDMARGQVNPLTVLRAFMMQRHARLKATPLDLATEIDLISTLKRRTRHADCANAVPKSAQRALYAYLATRRWIVTHDQCLFQSVTLLRFLLRYGWSPKLVIGVRMAPFAAHAWLQAGHLVLNDRLDQVLPYTPILVV